MNHEYYMVKEFHQKFGHPCADSPTLISPEDAKNQSDWILEEISEFVDAAEKSDIVEMADAMIDTIYCALGVLVRMGIEPDQLFNIVQNANMSKLWPDGKPHYNEVGKVIKPAGWQDPHQQLALAIEEMKNSSTYKKEARRGNF